MQIPVPPHHSLEPLPPIQKEPHLCYVAKRYKYLSLVLREQNAPGRQRNDLAFTLHQVEAKKLAEAILKGVAESVREDFTDAAVGVVEGIYIGGPPTPSELVDFNPGQSGRRD